MYHTRQGTCRICTAREAKYTDIVTLPVCIRLIYLSGQVVDYAYNSP